MHLVQFTLVCFIGSFENCDRKKLFWNVQGSNAPPRNYLPHLASAPIPNDCCCIYLKILSSTPLDSCNYRTLRYISSAVNLPWPQLPEFTQLLLLLHMR